MNLSWRIIGEQSEPSWSYNVHDFSVIYLYNIIYHGQCHTVIFNLVFNAHNFALRQYCNFLFSDQHVPVTPWHSKPTMRCTLLVLVKCYVHKDDNIGIRSSTCVV